MLNRAVHGKPLAYLDHAATSQKPAQVIRAECEFYGTCNANVHRSIHSPGEEATRLYEESRAKVARLVGASSASQTVFTSGATQAINLVARGWGCKFFPKGGRILVTEMEHHSNYVPWQQWVREREGSLSVVPVLEDGTLDGAGFRALLREGPSLVALTHISNVLGTVNPVAEWTREAHRVGAAVLVDAAQSVPHRSLRFEEIGCDFLVFSGHKMCGPTGTGALVSTPEWLERMDPFLLGGEMIDRVDRDDSTWARPPAKFEAGTPNIAGCIGLGAAADYLLALGLDAIEARERELTDGLLQRLRDLPGVRIFGVAPDRGAAVSFTVEDVHPHDLAQILDREGIAVRSGHLCAQPLMRRLGVAALTRASLAFTNTEEELDRLAAGILKARRIFGHGS